jgi:hypothetical protein
MPDVDGLGWQAPEPKALGVTGPNAIRPVSANLAHLSNSEARLDLGELFERHFGTPLVAEPPIAGNE